MTTAIDVGRRCRAARLAAGLSQTQAAEGLAFTGPYISRIENGDRRPSVVVLRQLAARYGVSAGWLETGRDVVELELDRALAARLRDAGVDAELRVALERSLETRVPA